MEHKMINQEIILGTLYPKTYPSVRTEDNICKRIILSIDRYTCIIDDSHTLSAQTYCQDYNSCSIDIKNDALQLYDIDKYTVLEAIYGIQHILSGKNIDKAFLHLSSPAIALCIALQLGIDIHEVISDYMRKYYKQYTCMNPFIGLPYVIRDNTDISVRSIRGKESNITLLDLDGEFICCRNFNTKVFRKNDTNWKAVILQNMDTYDHSHWNIRQCNYGALSSFIISSKLDNVITEENMYNFPDVMRLISILYVPNEIDLICKLIQDRRVCIEQVLKYMHNSCNVNNRKKVYTLIASLYPEYKIRVLKSEPDIDISITENDVKECIRYKIPLNRFLHLCSEEHKDLLLRTYPQKEMNILEHLKNRPKDL